MTLTALQSHNIEKAIAEGRQVEAVKLYRDAIKCDLLEAKTAIDAMTAELQERKPWIFRTSASTTEKAIRPARFRPQTLILFLLVDALIVGAIIFYFFMRDDSAHQAASTTNSVIQSAANQSKGSPRRVSLPKQVAESDYQAALHEGDTFRRLYLAKIDSAAYQRRKSGDSRSVDTSEIERKIKSARSHKAAKRELPAGQTLGEIRHSSSQPSLDGVFSEGEWDEATFFIADKQADTRLYLKIVGEWLFIGCDAPAEKTSGGYDQLRVYFHTGLLSKLVNERIHLGRSGGITSIRQTRFRWQGAPPASDKERWKKYAINDWGLYQHAYGASSMTRGHRQYEAAVHLGETGLHPAVPFTLYAEIETDPLRNAEGKFVERQYLGFLGSEQQPLWLQF
ncbi:hypothetical protein NCG89_09355 [Spongiibacter taiwanensis]|uniref:hypothetical protein n=1 Tax=Spongiibacter taiwanensis TaxID=1748242 RepID=UPI0020360650|nr:hypothetical protein [Spongiibacter taiwanensis]USA41725.1 hypothetical protein NCG89_09355 [Spongiibacter taiwanensis]